MNDVWIEPRARQPDPYTSGQVDRGRRLAKRADLLTGESQSTRVEIGDLFLEVVPDMGDALGLPGNAVLSAFAADVGISADTAREYRRVAAAFTHPLRNQVAASGATVSYSVIREAAIDSAGSGKPSDTRWNTLMELLAAAAAGGPRVTAQLYRQAIGARLTLDAGAGLTPERIISQLDRADVRTAVVACVTEPDYLRQVLMSDPAAEQRLRDTLTDVRRVHRPATEPSTAEPSEPILLQLRRRVHDLHRLLRMPPEQIRNVADADTLDELTQACRALGEWATRIENMKEMAR
ncbi:hypothetical protein ACFXD5_15685 [Streptomyces sp. NPDC059385]|uniref:hypothetical protein n=1 Tax=Streptomyces sp. NPDC059385 TaxID=3346817 RepID=UPI0036B40984